MPNPRIVYLALVPVSSFRSYLRSCFPGPGPVSWVSRCPVSWCPGIQCPGITIDILTHAFIFTLWQGYSSHYENNVITSVSSYPRLWQGAMHGRVKTFMSTCWPKMKTDILRPTWQTRRIHQSFCTACLRLICVSL